MADNRDILNTLIAEALGEGPEGMRRVAETINNRALIRGLTPEQVVTQPNQYTGYSNPGPAALRAMSDPAAISAAEAAWQLAQQPGDPTNGADHYFNPNVVRPSWAQSMTPTGDYGGHSFFSSQAVPRQAPVAPTPATQSQGLSSSRANTSPSGGNTALQSALSRLATARGNAVTPATKSAFNGDPLTPSSGPVVSAVSSRSQFNGDPLTPVSGNVVASIPTATNKSAIADAARRAALSIGANQTYAGQSGSTSRIGNAPATRTVQSVAMPPISPTPTRVIATNPPARPVSQTPARSIPLTTGVQQSYAGQDRATPARTTVLPTQSQLVAATGFTGPVPNRLPSGFNIPNTTNARGIAGVGTNAVAPIPYTRPTNLAPQTAVASALSTRQAPVPATMPAGLRTPIVQAAPMAAVAAPRVAQALLAQKALPAPTMSVVVNGGNPIARALSPVQQSAEWQRVTGTEPRYTDNGNGSRTASGGGVYYDRNYK